MFFVRVGIWEDKNHMQGTNTSAPGVNSYVPPKDWNDLNSDEKIERMREMVKSLSNSLGFSQRQVHQLRQKLSRHEHRDGKVVEIKEVSSYDDGGELLGASSVQDNKYF